MKHRRQVDAYDSMPWILGALMALGTAAAIMAVVW